MKGKTSSLRPIYHRSNAWMDSCSMRPETRTEMEVKIYIRLGLLHKFSSPFLSQFQVGTSFVTIWIVYLPVIFLRQSLVSNIYIAKLSMRVVHGSSITFFYGSQRSSHRKAETRCFRNTVFSSFWSTGRWTMIRQEDEIRCQLHAPASLFWGNEVTVSIGRKYVWAPEQVKPQRWKKYISLRLSRLEPRPLSPCLVTFLNCLCSFSEISLAHYEIFQRAPTLNDIGLNS
jgi:hypothetical protein